MSVFILCTIFFLGTAKKMFKLWVEKCILSSVKLDKVEERLASIYSLTDIGRIPTHISGNYGVFSAAEWKNWTTIFFHYMLFVVFYRRKITSVGRN